MYLRSKVFVVFRLIRRYRCGKFENDCSIDGYRVSGSSRSLGWNQLNSSFLCTHTDVPVSCVTPDEDIVRCSLKLPVHLLFDHFFYLSPVDLITILLFIVFLRYVYCFFHSYCLLKIIFSSNVKTNVLHRNTKESKQSKYSPS